MRVRERVAHAGLRRQVDDARERVPREQRLHRGAVGEFDPLEREARMRKPLQPRLLQPRVVVIIQVVDADHRLAARQQALSQVIADEAGSAGDENR